MYNELAIFQFSDGLDEDYLYTNCRKSYCEDDEQLPKISFKRWNI